MIVRTGVDLLETNRFEGISPGIRRRFLQRVYTERELAQAQDNDETLIALFSSKEAVSRALGTGIGPVAWREIEILHQPSGMPEVHLHGRAREIAGELGLCHWSLSISHSRSHVVAFVIALGSEPEAPAGGQAGV